MPPPSPPSPSRRWWPALCGWALLPSLGCQPTPVAEPAPAQASPRAAGAALGAPAMGAPPARGGAALEPAPVAVYSPFAVRIEGGFWIGTISFKDVGLRLAEEDARALVHETLAEAVAERLSARHAARLDFDPLVADPRWHTMCAGRHLYVDVWQASHPPRFGYSLWSGCGADDRLAWEEFPLPAALTERNALGAAVQLAERVVGHIDPCPSTVCG